MRAARPIAVLAATLAVLAWSGLAVSPAPLTARAAASAATNGASDATPPRPNDGHGTVYVGDVGIGIGVITLSRDGRSITGVALTFSVGCAAPTTASCTPS